MAELHRFDDEDAFAETNTVIMQISICIANLIRLSIAHHQVRSLINRNSQSKERLKVELTEFVAGGGNRCLLLQRNYGQSMGITLPSQV
ncbi:hypothetical protein PF008_g20928 [Phytophthora fragariae]|uniref:Uncharacterized protein n=1 Tax=Phytophthora fragariae TaxID=53985 RepID=A0A6G0QY37_9STRA|nr:hypothetical protein PF008_g20928 [Phytophthora fragariae]